MFCVNFHCLKISLYKHTISASLLSKCFWVCNTLRFPRKFLIATRAHTVNTVLFAICTDLNKYKSETNAYNCDNIHILFWFDMTTFLQRVRWLCNERTGDLEEPDRSFYPSASSTHHLLPSRSHTRAHKRPKSNASVGRDVYYLEQQ